MDEPIKNIEPVKTPETEKQPQPAQPVNPPAKSNNRKLWIYTCLILLAALLWIIYYFLVLQYYESTDDAYVNGSMISINSPVAGSVIAFYADDTDFVKEGDLLIELDTTAYQVAYDRELANLAVQVLQVRQLFDTVNSNEANLENKKIQYGKALYDFNNRHALIGSLAISHEDYIHSRDDLTSAELNMKQAEYQLAVSKDAAGNTTIENHPLIEEQKQRVITAYYNLTHTKIYSPATGYVAQRTVDVGEWAKPETDLMAIIPIDYVWVDANFKETQLTYMRIGQPATVWLDIYGSKAPYKGTVLGIASGTGSVFSLIPPQNATGNWIKIVQRLPVRISLDPTTLAKHPPRIGLSADAEVDITNQDLPMLAKQPPTKAITKTGVFDLDLKPVMTLINEVIEKNLKVYSP